MTAGELALQVERALAELREYEGFISQLEGLKRSLGSGEFDDSILQATQGGIPGHLRAHRGVIPADDRLTETRLLINELNRIIKARRKKRD